MSVFQAALPALGLLLAVLCMGAEARAQWVPGATDSLSCRQQCGALLPRRQDNTGDVQICLARCETRERVQPPRAASRAVAPPRAPRRLPAQAARQHVPTRPHAVAPSVPEMEKARYGVIYLAPPPSVNYGLTVGLEDRNAAHRLSEQQCMGPQGAACRLVEEFQDRCGAVAQGLIPRGLFLTNSPTTFNVMLSVPGTGATQALAERDAMTNCRQRFRGTCRVAGSRCAAPG
jgi:hypothetical protein